MNLRKAKISDLITIISWIPNKLACRNWGGPKVRFPIRIKSLSEEIEFSENNSFCLFDNESLIAFGQLLAKGNGYLHLARIIVAPHKRANGHGWTLCNLLIQTAKQKGYNNISLNVYRDNTSAFKLYEKIGFREDAKKSSNENCHMILS